MRFFEAKNPHPNPKTSNSDFHRRINLDVLRKIHEIRIPITIFQTALKYALKQPLESMAECIMSVRQDYIDHVDLMRVDNNVSL